MRYSGMDAYGVQYVANDGSQLLAGKGLLNQVYAGVETTLMNDGVAGVSGHVQNFQGGLMLFCFLREFSPVHPGQDHVGEKQVDAVGFAQLMQGVLGVRGFEYAVAKHPERLYDVAPNVGIILDDQDTLP